MDEYMKLFNKMYPDIFFDMIVVPNIKKHSKVIFADLEKNICLEHYNELHKTSFTENDIELNQTECWVCKQRAKGRR